MKKIWTEEKIKFLKENVDNKTNKELALLLNNTEGNVATYLWKYNIKRKNRQREITYIINGECHECNSHCLNAYGYPMKKYKGRQQLMARYIYEQYYHTEIPEGYCIRHKCDNKRCINPLHLEIGLPIDNTRDAVERNRYKKGSQNGSAKLNEEQVIQIKNKVRQGKMSKQLAKEYNVSKATIDAIREDKSWSWLKEDKNG